MSNENTNAADSIDSDSDSDAVSDADAIRYHAKRITSEAVSDPDAYGERSRFHLDGYTDVESLAWRSTSSHSDDMRVIMGVVKSGSGGIPMPKPFVKFDVPSINRFIRQGLTAIRCIESGDGTPEPSATPSRQDLSDGQQVLDDRGVAVLLQPLANAERIRLGMIPSDSYGESELKSGAHPDATSVADFSPPAVEGAIDCAIDARNELQGTEEPLGIDDAIINVNYN